MTPYDELAGALRESIPTMDKLEARLMESVEICRKLNFDALPAKDDREIEAMTARFKRAHYIFVAKTLRLIDVLEGSEGTTIDVLNRSEKRGIIESASDFRKMRVLRNTIAHEYSGYGPSDVARDVLEFVPKLLDAFQRAREYANRPEFSAG
jgi:uncharacterized protein YutE (UPF0331/DUF86 family)